MKVLKVEEKNNENKDCSDAIKEKEKPKIEEQNKQQALFTSHLQFLNSSRLQSPVATPGRPGLGGKSAEKNCLSNTDALKTPFVFCVSKGILSLMLRFFLLGVFLGGYVLCRTCLKTVSTNVPFRVAVPTLKKGAATKNLLGDTSQD